MMASFTGH